VADITYARRHFDVLGLAFRAVIAFLVAIGWASGRMTFESWLIFATALIALCAAFPPSSSVTVDSDEIQLRRGWSHLSLPRGAIRTARPVDVTLRLIAGRTSAPNEWHETFAAQRGVELVFRSDLPARLKSRLPDEHTFRIICSDSAGLLNALTPAVPHPA
jgi:hypothetical protein